MHAACGSAGDETGATDVAEPIPDALPGSDATDATDATDPDAAEPDATKLDVPEPDTTVPDGSEPDATKPDATKPDAIEPDATKPDAIEPDATKPDAIEPDATKPDATKPDATEPDATELECEYGNPCDPWETCQEGTCVPMDGCGAINFTGCCLGEFNVYCSAANQLGLNDCGSGCGWNDFSKYYGCVNPGEVDPTGVNPIDCPYSCLSLDDCPYDTNCVDGVCVSDGPTPECDAMTPCAIGLTCVAGACTDTTDDCAAKPCWNGGTCSDQVNGFSCVCVDGFAGDTCAENIDDCAPNPCVNGVCEDGVETFDCLCDSGWEGDTCAKNTDDCDPNPCLNGGECIDGLNTGSCECAPGYQGSTCAQAVVGPCEDKDCSDEHSCTVDTCDSDTGDCSNDLKAGFCLISDGCYDSGESKGSSKINQCLICDPAAPTVWSDSTGACDDEDLCTLDDTCGAAGCKGEYDPCDDGKCWTFDMCEPWEGCTHQLDDTMCTYDDTCYGWTSEHPDIECQFCDVFSDGWNNWAAWNTSPDGTECGVAGSCDNNGNCVEP
jgi:hypothetical protein